MSKKKSNIEKALEVFQGIRKPNARSGSVMKDSDEREAKKRSDRKNKYKKDYCKDSE